MRNKYSGVFRDGAGKIVASGNVSVYLAGTSTAASIYTSSTSTSAVNSVTTGTDGTFTFYIDRFDYDRNQLFKISLSKSGYTTKEYDNVDVKEVITGTYTISADKTVTTDLGYIPKGVIYSVASGKTLTISGALDSGRYQIFSGTGAVTLTNATISRPEWFGIDGTDDHTEINAAINSLTSGTVLLGPAYTTSGTINVKSGVDLVGVSGGYGYGTTITYTGAGVAVKFDRNRNSGLSKVNIITSNDSAVGIEITNACRRLVLNRVYVYGGISPTNNGKGIYLNAGTGWTGGIGITHVTVQGYKTGIDMVGSSAANTVTTVDMSDVWLIGLAAAYGGPISGAKGISMNARTTGTGTYLRGGTIESFATGIYHENGGLGGFFDCDFEANTNNYSVGNSFNGRIHSAYYNTFYEQSIDTASTIFKSYVLSRTLAGLYTLETKGDQRYVYRSGKGQWGVWLGAHNGFYDGGNPVFYGGFQVDATDADKNKMRIKGQSISFGTAAPKTGTWGRGSVRYNTAATSGQPIGWQCTSEGTFSAASTTGSISSGAANLTVASTTGLAVDDYVTIAGVTGIKRILYITGSVLTLDSTSDATVSGAAVATPDPTFSSIGNLP